MNLFSPCDKCKDSGKPGYLYKEMEGQTVIVECECHTKWRIREKLKLDAKKSNLWCSDEFLSYEPRRDYVGQSSRSKVENLYSYIDHCNDPKYMQACLYLWGPNGTQKTFLAQWLGLQLLKNKKTVQFLLMDKLIKGLSSGFDSDPEIQEFKQNMLDVDVLILDESFARDKVTLYKSGYQLPYLDSFLRERCDSAKKGIIFISNTNPENIATEGFGVSIQDFIIRKTKPSNSIFKMNDVYMKLKTSFDADKLFED